jgi:hypothetical protein
MNHLIQHLREHSYMSGVERDNLRIKQTAEVFTHTHLVQEILDQLETADPTLFSDPTKTFLDNSCGDGQFLSEVVLRKMETSGCSFEDALATTYGVELMHDNVAMCKRRLAGPKPTPEILAILDRNIVCADSLTYHYRFDGTPATMTDTELTASEFFAFAGT